MILFNSYNTIGMGTSTISRYVIDAARELSSLKCIFILPAVSVFKDQQSSENIRVFLLPCPGSSLRYVFRLFYDFFIFPLMTLFFRPSGVVVMANYAPFPVFGRKTVIMRHPYLVDDSQDEELGLLRQILERARRVVFWMTLKTTDELVVQSQLMKQLIYEKYSSLNCRVSVLPNPLIKTNVSDSSKNIEHVAQCLTADFAALYVSRYYVHKNHDFILQICKTYKNELLREGVKFYVTLDINATPEASSFLSAIEQLELGDIIVNLGERPREELTSLYQEASCLFFPSKAETFGNPLVEAMDSGLPVVVPDMPYAKAICEEAAAYYKTDDVESAFSVICRLIKSREFRDELNEKGQKRASAFPGPTAWLNKVVEISSGEVRN